MFMGVRSIKEQEHHVYATSETKCRFGAEIEFGTGRLHRGHGCYTPVCKVSPYVNCYKFLGI
jgi:hypothetical protein